MAHAALNMPPSAPMATYSMSISSRLALMDWCLCHMRRKVLSLETRMCHAGSGFLLPHMHNASSGEEEASLPNAMARLMAVLKVCSGVWGTGVEELPYSARGMTLECTV